MPDTAVVQPALEWLDGAAVTGALSVFSLYVLIIVLWPDREWWMSKLSMLYEQTRSGFGLTAPAPEATTPFHARICLQMEEARQIRFGYLIQAFKVSSPILWLVCTVLSVIMTRSAAMSIPNVVWQLSCFWASRHSNSAHAKPVFKLLMFVILLRSTMNAGSSSFLMLAGTRTLFRVFLGLGVLDYRVSIYWNVLLSAALCIVFHFSSASSLAEDLGANWTFTGVSMIHAGIEFWTCALLCVLLYACESQEEARVRTSVESTEARKALQAARSLLSVLCDAQVHVGADSEIIFCTAPLRHLLLPGECVTDSEILGTTFLQYVAECDQARFRDFIAGGSASPAPEAQAGGEGSSSGGPADFVQRKPSCSPPAAIQIYLRNGVGDTVPVEVFHVEFPDLNGAPGHLMGIREAGTQPREVLADAPGTVAFSKVSAQIISCSWQIHDLPRSEMEFSDPQEQEWSQRLESAIAECPEEAAAMAREPWSAGVEGHGERPHRPAEAEVESAPSESSSEASSQSSQGLLDSGVESVFMSVNTTSRRMRVNSIVLHFRGSSRRCPGIADWMQAGPFLGLARGCQQAVNELSNGKGSAGKLGQVEFAAKGEPFMCAESAEVVMGDDPEDVLLRLDDLSPLAWLPWALQGGVRSHRRRPSSRSSKQLETISEATPLSDGSRRAAERAPERTPEPG